MINSMGLAVRDGKTGLSKPSSSCLRKIGRTKNIKNATRIA